MSLDITFKQRKAIRCPHCGEIADYKIVCSASSGGRDWYDFLEPIGYYVPHHLRTEENDWYGKDMVLTEEQARAVRQFVKEHNVYDLEDIIGLISDALLDGDNVIVNADW